MIVKKLNYKHTLQNQEVQQSRQRQMILSV